MGKLAVMCRCLGALDDGGEAKVAGQMSGSSTRPSGPGTSNFNCDQDSRAVLIEPFPILYSVKPPLVRMMCFKIQPVSLLHLHLCLSRGSRMRLSKCFEHSFSIFKAGTLRAPGWPPHPMLNKGHVRPRRLLKRSFKRNMYQQEKNDCARDDWTTSSLVQ